MKRKLNQNKEWAFIVKEVHKESYNGKNLLKREILFILQLLLSKNEVDIYLLTKKHYLSF